MECIRTYPVRIVSMTKSWCFSDAKTVEEFEELFLSVRHEDDLVGQYRIWWGGSKEIHLSNN